MALSRFDCVSRSFETRQDVTRGGELARAKLGAELIVGIPGAGDVALWIAVQIRLIVTIRGPVSRKAK
jgi:hypothetical protein